MSSARFRRWGLAVAFLAGSSLLGSGCGGGSESAAQRAATSKRGSKLTVQCTGTGAHDRHAAMNIGCTVCHPCGGALAFNGFTYSGGTSATGTVTPGSGTTPATCAVACHSPLNAPAHSVAWNQGPLDCTACHTPTALPSTHPPLTMPNPTGADCVTCHDMSKHTTGTVTFAPHPATWMNQADPGFHAFSANKGLAACQGCHGQDLAGGITGVACAQCHDTALPTGVTTWKKNCVMCHGGTDNPTGAPPKATWGNSADLVRIGAHSAHVTASAISPAFGCALCHVKPVDAFSPGHIDGSTATVAFDGLAVGIGALAPAWDRTSATCSNTYCHGAFRNGNAAAPDWTKVGQGQGACGTCHGLPPPAAAHPAVGSDLTVCAVCHPKTMDGSGHIIPPAQGGLHLDGLIEAAGHDASWMDTASPNFHAFSAVRGLAGCQACHGPDLSGGTTGVACATCHGGPSWKTNCTMCHGGVANATGAPPNSVWGTGDPQRGGGTPDPIRVGAHTAHVQGTLATSFDCGQCHVTPTDAFSAGHVDGPVATVTFGQLASKGAKPPVYTRANGATCASTYCHGGYTGTYTYSVWDWGLDEGVAVTTSYAGKNATPKWTDGPMACNSCHDNPPRNGTWHSGQHGYFTEYNNCELCHPDAIGTVTGGTAITNLALHVNGIVDVTPKWQPSKCFGCH